MPWFDVVLGMVHDYMHGCLLGVTKTLLYKWFSATNHEQPYFIGGQVQYSMHYKLFPEKNSKSAENSMPRFSSACGGVRLYFYVYNYIFQMQV